VAALTQSPEPGMPATALPQRRPSALGDAAGELGPSRKLIREVGGDAGKMPGSCSVP